MYRMIKDKLVDNKISQDQLPVMLSNYQIDWLRNYWEITRPNTKRFQRHSIFYIISTITCTHECKLAPLRELHTDLCLLRDAWVVRAKLNSSFAKRIAVFDYLCSLKSFFMTQTRGGEIICKRKSVLAHAKWCLIC